MVKLHRGTKSPDITESIKSSLKRHKGVVTRVCKEVGIVSSTYYKIMAENPDIKVVQDTARQDYEVHQLDEAESTLMYAIGKREEDLTNALKSTFFILNNKGAERGYSPKNNPNRVEVSSDAIAEFVRNASKTTGEIS